MPVALPAERLPTMFSAWDEAADALPALYSSLALRRELRALPLLCAAEEHLPEKLLLRAASVLSILVHAYSGTERDVFTTLQFVG